MQEGSSKPSCIWRWIYFSDFQGLLATSLLPRLRYILEVTCPGPSVVLDILAMLIRLARHSLESATRVRKRRQGVGEDLSWAWS